MRKCVTALAGALAVLALALLVPSGANAGASASAPSKYARANQASSHSYPLTEYSSSARKTSHKH